MALGNFNKLKEVERLGILINKNKTVYEHKKSKAMEQLQDNIEFEQFDSFKYLGSVVNNKNAIEEEIKERTAVSNKVLCANRR